MATIYVSKTAGSDTTGTGQQNAPYATVGKGNSVAVANDTVLVEAGTYNEAVVPNNGVKFIAAPGGRPVLDGGGTLDHGFFTNSSTRANIRVEGFEIRNFTQSGVRLQMSGQNDLSGHVVFNNHIHHIGVVGATTYAYGIYCTYGNTSILSNEIHHIGHESGNESSGIWCGYCHDYRVDSNRIYNVRKEGIRDYFGLNAQITNNRVFLNWVGIALNKSISALVANNYLYWNVRAFNPKHTNEAKSFWSLDPADPNLPFCRFWHNTCYRSSDCHLWLAVNIDPGATATTGYMYDVDMRNNIVHGLAGSHIWDNPTSRRGTTIVDYNIYTPLQTFVAPPAVTPDTPVFFYRTGYSFGATGTTKTMAQTVTDLGWNTHSQEADPLLNNPDGGDFDYGAGSPAAAGGAALASTWGTQMGARGLGAANTTYVPDRPATAINSKSPSTFTNQRVRAANELQPVYFQTASTADEWVIFDFGSVKSFNQVSQEQYAHGSPVNIAAYRIETSNDQTTWTQIRTGVLPDSGEATYRYELASTATCRYVRFTAQSSWGQNVIYADIKFGLLTRTDDPSTPPAPADTTAPTVALTAPANGATVSGSVVITATASDDTSVEKVELTAGGKLVATLTIPPYTGTWVTSAADAGSRTITAKAYDAAGNTATDSRSVTVTTVTPPVSVVGPRWGASLV